MILIFRRNLLLTTGVDCGKIWFASLEVRGIAEGFAVRQLVGPIQMVLACLIAIELSMLAACPCRLSLSSCRSTLADANTLRTSVCNDCSCGMACRAQYQPPRDTSRHGQRTAGSSRSQLVHSIAVAGAPVAEVVQDTTVGSRSLWPTSIGTLATLQLQCVRLQV
jgi:hypothetical protein